jgi:predicted PurR-regulated permease PerM
MGLLDLARAHLSAEDIAALRARIGSVAGPDALAWVGRTLGGLWGGGVAFFNLLSLLFITPLVAFYLLRDWDGIVAVVDDWLPRDHAPVIRAQLAAVDRVLSGFVRGQLTVCLVLGVFYALGLGLVRLDFGLVIGLATGLISFVPVFGTLVGFAVGIGVALVQFGFAWQVAAVAGVFLAGQAIEGNFLTPKLVGSRVGLHPVWTIFALLAGGALAGFTGLLLAVPAAAVIGVLSRFAVARWVASDAYRGDDGPGT